MSRRPDINPWINEYGLLSYRHQFRKLKHRFGGSHKIWRYVNELFGRFDKKDLDNKEASEKFYRTVDISILEFLVNSLQQRMEHEFKRDYPDAFST